MDRACAETMHVVDAVEGVNSARVEGAGHAPAFAGIARNLVDLLLSHPKG